MADDDEYQYEQNEQDEQESPRAKSRSQSRQSRRSRQSIQTRQRKQVKQANERLLYQKIIDESFTAMTGKMKLNYIGYLQFILEIGHPIPFDEYMEGDMDIPDIPKEAIDSTYTSLIKQIIIKLDPFYQADQTPDLPLEHQYADKNFRIIRRIIERELKLYSNLKKTDPDGIYYGIDLKRVDADETGVVLRVIFYDFDESSPLGRSLEKFHKSTGKKPVIRLQYEFKGEHEAPFLWVRTPILKSINTFGIFDGALCIEGLTSGSYTFTDSIGHLLQTVRLMLQDNTVVEEAGYYKRNLAFRGRTYVETAHSSWNKSKKK